MEEESPSPPPTLHLTILISHRLKLPTLTAMMTSLNRPMTFLSHPMTSLSHIMNISRVRLSFSPMISVKFQLFPSLYSSSFFSWNSWYTTSPHLFSGEAEVAFARVRNKAFFCLSITTKLLGLVKQTAVYHWLIEGDCEHVKMFHGTATSGHNQIGFDRIAPGSPEFSDEANPHRYLRRSAMSYGDVQPTFPSDSSELIAESDFEKVISADDHISICGFGSLLSEYAYSSKATTKCDVYSFGVVLVEILTGKKPVEAEFGENKNIINWVSIKVNKPETTRNYYY